MAPSSLPSATELKQEAKQEAKAATQSTTQSLRALAAGGVGGICAVLVGHPLDLVKVRLQTAEQGAYNGALDVVRKTVGREGLRRGLYAGVSAPLVGVTPMFAVSFWGYDMGKHIVTRFSSTAATPGTFSVAQLSAAGFLSALPMTLITAPFERVKVLLQIQGQKTLAPGEKPQYSGGLDVVRQLYRTGGLRSVFRGSVMTLARDGPGSAAYFATYEVVKRRLTPAPSLSEGESEHGAQREQRQPKLSLSAITLAGAAAGVAMWIPVFPVDTVKSRMQGAAGNGPAPTVFGTVKDVYRRGGGVKAFFPGIGPALARAVPANAATFLGVEMAQRLFARLFD